MNNLRKYGYNRNIPKINFNTYPPLSYPDGYLISGCRDICFGGFRKIHLTHLRFHITELLSQFYRKLCDFSSPKRKFQAFGPKYF